MSRRSRPGADPFRRPSAGYPRRPRAAPSRSSRDGEEAGDGGAAALDALHLDGAAVLLQYLVADSQAQAEPALLGGEERVEDPRPGRSRNAAPLVHHLSLDHVPLTASQVDLAEQRVHA